MNCINIIGRLTKDPELKFGQSGTAVARFTVAVARKMDKDKTDFFNCVAFKKTAEVISEYFKKGNQIGITGNVQINEYEVNGEKKKSVDVFVESITFLDKKKTEKTDDESIKDMFGDKEDFNNDLDDTFPF
ncbi:MAG: single-stranded DNA-binding protein [Fusobacterium gastrosuis]|uniref:single-stranded DNA-binding protein n=1 Tax=Fusobacterium gastrosuis TaxID=1755100 RepID=UPI002A87E447|nr:single-stranded DNA-binding protein [Fusobacterium gastrosuis]MDY5795500.1 single-stranded DNA-binding protein [Fusobacterium gastrosuis]